MSCPYRQDAPSGLWHPEEYLRLLKYDDDPGVENAGSVFMCHQQDGALCRGWVDVHFGTIPVRLALTALDDDIDPDIVATPCSTPLFDTAAQAARHGLTDITNPGANARRLIGKLTRRTPTHDRPHRDH